MRTLLIILSVLSLELSAQHYAQVFAPVFVHPVRVDKEYNTHGVYVGLFLKGNKIKSNGIHASLISIGNDIKVNGIHASLLSVRNTIKVNGICVNLISYSDFFQNSNVGEVNGLHINMINIGSGGIRIVNAEFAIKSFPKISFTALKYDRFLLEKGQRYFEQRYHEWSTPNYYTLGAGSSRKYHSRYVLDIGLGLFSVEFRDFSINVGLIASARRDSYVNIGVLNYNHSAFISISPLIGIR